MRSRWVGQITAVITIFSVLFLLFYVLATRTTFLAADGSYLNQGYAGADGDVNLSNIAVGAVVALVVSVAVNKLFAKVQLPITRLVQKIGIITLLLLAAVFLFFVAAVAYLIFSGQLLEGWQF